MKTARFQYIGAKRTRVILSQLVPWFFGIVLTPQAWGAFTGAYAPEKLTLTNIAADGFVTSAAGGGAIFLTGGNEGSGVTGTTDVTVEAAAAGIVQFHYVYSSLDLPGFDRAGYLLGALFVLLADSDGQSAGPIAFTVSSGQTFGWRIVTDDNQGEPGVLAISNFTAPGAARVVPEPGALPVLFIGAAALGALRLKNRAGTVSEGRR